MQSLREGALLQEGKYRIKRVLGQGGFGITYLAEQVALGRQVAIKEFFMKEMCGRDAETSHVTLGTGAGRETVQRFREKFLKEARNIASLDHPGIVRIYDVFEENGTAYYVMEYLRGGSLKAMTEKHPLSEAVAVEMVRRVADALAYIHSRHMLHLDVKPSNILLRKVGEQPVLIDFGISKHYDAQGEQTTTMQAGISKGYAPMEQYSQEMQAFTPSTDIYSLGATLYSLLTGQTPPEASLLLNDQSLPSFYPRVSSRTWHAVLQCMQPRRKDRPQSIPQFLRLFENEAEDDTVIIDTEGPRSAPSRPAAKPRVSKWWAWVLIAILFGGIGYGAMRWMGHGETTNVPMAAAFLPAAIQQLEKDMVFVEGGTFTMGATVEQGSDADDNEKPTHLVTLSSFCICKHEVTQAEWEAVMGTNPSKFKGANRPVEQVSWDDCQTFIRKLNSMTGKAYRLPTEAEWEYAARGGKRSCGYKYSGSNTLGDVAWYYENSGRSRLNDNSLDEDKLFQNDNCTHDVMMKQANELGLYDMSGNVWEWCNDRYGDYSTMSQMNPQGTFSGSGRVDRGGSWYLCAEGCRVSNRYGPAPSFLDIGLGLRLAQ